MNYMSPEELTEIAQIIANKMNELNPHINPDLAINYVKIYLEEAEKMVYEEFQN